MTDPRRLLARLNPTTIRYDVGRGGTPELTSQDIAAALAFVPAGLGREVFCALWWPDGARLSSFALWAAISNLVHAEMERRHRAMQVARLALHIAEEEAESRQTAGAAQRRELSKLQQAAEEAEARLWPFNPQMHVRIRRAVLDELASPNHCPHCGGAGETMAGELRIACPQCEGRGTLPPSNRSRALRLNCDPANYHRRWRGLYEWLHNEIADAEATARRQFRAALRDNSSVHTEAA